MQTIKINLKKIAQEKIDFIVNQFKRGKVVIYPTDTIYGLGCIATSQKAVNAIFKIKKRSEKKPLLILASSMAMLKKYAYLSQKQANYIKISSIKPTTFILKDRGKLAKGVAGADNSLAVRLPNSEFLTKIIDKTGFPIVSTSVNISGRESIMEIKTIERVFQHKVDLIISAGKPKIKKPSKIVDIRDVNNIIVLRK